MNISRIKNNTISKTYLTVSILGNSLKLNIKYKNNDSIELNKTNTEIIIIIPKKYKNLDNINIINLAIKKMYNKIAETEIEYAMEIARHILKFAPNDYTIKRLDNAFYKCLKNKIIVNPDIVKYNRDIINTTILQAFCRIKYKYNSASYKNYLNEALHKYELYKNNSTSKLSILKIS